MRANQRQQEEQDNHGEPGNRQPVLAEAPCRVLPQVALFADENAAVVDDSRDFGVPRSAIHCTRTRGSRMG